MSGSWYDPGVPRIAIDARVITSEPDGVGRYARELVPALAVAAPDHEWLVLRHPSNRDPIAGGLPNVHEVYIEGVVGRMVDHFLTDRRRLQAVFDVEGWPDLYHSLFHMYAFRFPGQRRPRPRVVVTLHDLIWLDYPLAHGSMLNGMGTWMKARTAIAHSLRRADHVIAVSEATARAGRRWLSADRVTVVHHGVNRMFFGPAPALPAALACLAQDGRPWIAALGESKKYKNLELLLDAFASATRQGIDARLVLLGRCASLARDAHRLGVAERVLFPGEVDDEDLRAIVGGAALFVHPAIVEGFGMPVVEAMALGTPTAVADVPALREVGGAGALRFPAGDSRALAEIIQRMAGSRELRTEWSARARARAACFDWTHCADETLDVYRSALSRS